MGKQETAKKRGGCCADDSCTPETCMDLPTGTTCGDCAHVRWCVMMFGKEASHTSCGWFPRRLHATATPEAS
jgi:hypothetical protein